MCLVIHEPVNCITAEEFLNKISPMGDYFKKENLNSPWLFRGQGQDWPLIPSLFRKNAINVKLLTNRNVESGYSELLCAERDIILEFFSIADKHGLIIPDDSQELRSTLESVRATNDGRVVHTGVDFRLSLNNSEWLTTSKVLSLVSLAQHYRVPTRLLDWSLHPFTAAFFAAEGGLERYDKETGFENLDIPLVVWAFYFPSFGIESSLKRSDYTIKGVTAPRGNNPNLKAQQGVFTLVHPRHTNEADNNYFPFEKILENIGDSGWSKGIMGCELRKFTLPVTETFELLRYLAKLGVTFSFVYPGYHSIISDMQMKKKWGEKWT